MIVWLASYPRSGNTFLRMLLRHGLGLDTYSLHAEGDDRDFASQEGLADIVGHVPGIGGAELVERAQNSADLHVIKTHQPPLSDDPAIYVLRDGRASIVSFFHYFSDRNNAKPTEEIIGEMEHFGSWSSHYHAWEPTSRPNTLFLRFEDVTADPTGTVKKIADFLNLPVAGDFNLSFEQLNQTAPKFFRNGDNRRNIAEMEPYLGPFALAHGELMVEMGYMTEREVADAIRDYAHDLSDSRVLTPPPEPTLMELREQRAVIEANAHERYATLHDLLQTIISRHDKLVEGVSQTEARFETNAHERYATLLGLLQDVIGRHDALAERLSHTESALAEFRRDSQAQLAEDALTLKRLALLGLLNTPRVLSSTSSRQVRHVLGPNARSKILSMTEDEIKAAMLELDKQTK